MKGKLRRLLAIFLVVMLLRTNICAVAETAAILTLPSGLQIIEEEAFYGNTSIGKVIVPEGTTQIRSRAFADSSLKEVELPETLNYVADNAFEGCENIQVITPEGSYAYEWAVENGYIVEKAPSIPEGLVVQTVNTDRVKISWAAAEYAEGYEVYNNGTLAGTTVGGNACEFICGGLNENSDYSFQVRAFRYTAKGELIYGGLSATIVGKTANKLAVSATAVNDRLTVSEEITVNTEVVGGYGECTYRYTVKRDEEIVAVSGECSTASYSYSPTMGGTYSVVVAVTDTLGRMAGCQVNGIIVNEEVLEVGNTTVDQSVIMLGKTVTISTDNNREDNLTYSANVYCGDVKVDAIIGVGKLTYTPSAVGVYSFAVEVTDAYGETEYEYLKNAVTVTPYWEIAGISASKNSAIVGDTITFTASLQGEVNDVKLTYTVYRDSEIYRQLTDVSQTEYEFTANDVGVYSCICVAIDNYNNKVEIASPLVAVTRSSIMNTSFNTANYGNTLDADVLDGKDSDEVRVPKGAVTITWDKLSNDSYYELEIGCIKLGLGIIYDENYTGNSYTIAASQVRSGYEYYVDVYRYDKNGKCIDEMSFYFTVTGAGSLKLEESLKLIVPTKNASVNYDDLTIQWEQMNYAEAIEIILEYDCGKDDHEILRETLSGNATMYTIPRSVLQNGKSHTVEIVAKDSLGYTSSDDITFYVGCEGKENVVEITKPVLTSEFLDDGNQLLKVPTYPVYEALPISWDDIPAAEWYSVHLENEEDGTELIYDNIQGNCCYVSPSELKSGNVYLVWVYAHHTVDCYRKSDYLRFRAPYKGNLLLDPPKLVSPDLSKDKNDPTTFVRQDLIITWEPVTAAVAYDVEMRFHDEANSVDFEATGLKNPTVTIPKENIWLDELNSIVISAYDASGNTTYEKYYFKATNSTLVAPVLLSPALSTDKSDMPAYAAKDMTLIWGAVEGAVEYRVQVRDYYTEDWDLIIDAQGVKDETYTIPADELYLGGRFRVRIRAIDQYGNNIYSESYYFQIGSTKYIDLSLDSWTFGYEGGSKNFFVHTARKWKAAVSESWISVSRSSGDASMQLTITVEENDDDFPRSGNVTFINEAGGCVVFSVVQEGNGSANTGALKITNPDQGETLDYAGFRTHWSYNYDHAYFNVRLYDVTSNKTVYEEDQITAYYEDIPQSALTYGHIYQLTVEAYNAKYSKISESSIVFKVESLNDGSGDGTATDDDAFDDTDVPEGVNEIIYAGISDGSEISLIDTSVSWQNVIGADYYWVALRDMTLYPEGTADSDVIKIIDQETDLLMVNILEGQLTAGHSYRLWIAAHKDDAENPINGKLINFSVKKAADEGDEPEATDTLVPSATLSVADDQVVLGDSIALSGRVLANGGILNQVRVTVQDAQTGEYCDYAIYDLAGIGSYGSYDSFDLSNVPAIPTGTTIHESGSGAARPGSTSIELNTAGNRYKIVVYGQNNGSDMLLALASKVIVLTDEHRHVPATTVYAYHEYEPIAGDNVNHTCAAIIWRCVCGTCSEQYYFRDEVGIDGSILPYTENHQWDKENTGICLICGYQCQHRFEYLNEWKDGSGVWQDCGDGTHIRTSVIQYKQCADCGHKIGETVQEEFVPEAHNDQRRQYYLSYEQYDASAAHYHTQHKATIETWTYCSAYGCGYEEYLGTSTVVENHKIIDGECDCGYSAPTSNPVYLGDNLTLMWSLSDYEHDYFVDAEGIEVLNDHTEALADKYLGVWVERNGEQITGSEGGEYLFEIQPYDGGVLDESTGRVYASEITAKLDNGSQYVALQKDNYTFYCRCDGKFYIMVYRNPASGKKRLVHTIEVKVIQNADRYLLGEHVGYKEGEMGYTRSVETPPEVEAMLHKLDSREQRRLWFDLNTSVGELKVFDQMPVYEFEFIDEEKNTLGGFMQLVVASGIRQTVTELTDFSVAGILKKLTPVVALKPIIEMLDTDAEKREAAEMIVWYLESIDPETLEGIQGMWSLEVMKNEVSNEAIVKHLLEVIKLAEKYGVNPTKWPGIFKAVNNASKYDEMMSLVAGIGLDFLYNEYKVMIDYINAAVVLEKIEKGLISMTTIPDELREEVIAALQADYEALDDTVGAVADSITSGCAGSLIAKCPGIGPIYVTLKVGSGLLGYEEFESGLKQILIMNNRYDESRDKLVGLLEEYKYDPSVALYDQVMLALEEYNTYTAVCIAKYEAWCKEEASSPLKKAFPKSKYYIASAEATRVSSNEKLKAYYNRIANGALR